MNTVLLYKRLGAIIKERRAALGLTQEQLASHLELSRASVANMETGRQKILIHQLYRLADKLDVEVAELLPAPEEQVVGEVWRDLPLPKNLSAEQGEQIARLLQGDDTATRRRGNRGKDQTRKTRRSTS